MFCAACRRENKEGKQWRVAISGSESFECPHGIPWGFQGKQEPRPNPDASQVADFIAAMLLSPRVTDKVRAQRHAQCDKCDRLRVADGVKFCGMCGCKVSKRGFNITDLCAYQENLPKWGCKHPERGKGKGWPIEKIPLRLISAADL